MRKDQQKIDNLKCQAAWKAATKEINWHELKSYPLYKCNARMIKTDRYFILESYDSLVAVYDTQKQTLCDCLRDVYGYTATSAQHIRKFENWLNNHGYCICSFLRYYDVR